jgi:hypothetical protein
MNTRRLLTRLAKQHPDLREHLLRRAEYSEEQIEDQVQQAGRLDAVDPSIAEFISTSGLDDGNANDDKIPVSRGSWSAASLKPSQTTIRLPSALKLALKMLDTGKVGGDLGAMISKDGHILDGHHRWAATVLAAGSKGKVGGYRAGVNGKELIKVLNLVSKGKFGVRNGNPGSGSIADLNPRKVASELQSYVQNGASDKYGTMSPEKVQSILEKSFGSVEEGIQQVARNAGQMNTSVPSWAPDRKQMPVINGPEAPEAAAMLNQGVVNWNAPHVEQRLAIRRVLARRGLV